MPKNRIDLKYLTSYRFYNHWNCICKIPFSGIASYWFFSSDPVIISYVSWCLQRRDNEKIVQRKMLLWSEVTGFKNVWSWTAINPTKQSRHYTKTKAAAAGDALGKIVRPVVFVFDSRPRQKKSWKRVVTATLLNVRQQVWVSRVLGDDHFKRMALVTVGV